MATTDMRLAARLLRSLDDCGNAFAVLHRAEELERSGPASDVDIVVDRPVWDFARLLVERRTAHDLFPVMFLHYDHGCLSSFWMTADGTGGVQLDAMCDPAGRNRYGFCTRNLGVDTHRWPPRLAPEERETYLLVKRLVKGDIGRAQAHAAGLRAIGLDPSESVSRLISRPRRDEVLRALENLPESTGLHAGVVRQRLNRRGWDRALHPIGVRLRVCLAPSASAADVLAPFSSVLVSARLNTPGLLDRIKRPLEMRRPSLVLDVRRSETEALSTEQARIFVRRRLTVSALRTLGRSRGGSK